MTLRFSINPATGEPHIHDHGVTETEVDRATVGRLLAHYESQTGDEAIAEDEAAISAGAAIIVPRGLVPLVEALITGRQLRRASRRRPVAQPARLTSAGWSPPARHRTRADTA